MFICVGVQHMGYCMEARGQLVGVGSLLPLCEFWGSNLGCQVLGSKCFYPLFIFETGSQVAQAGLQLCVAEEVLELVILLPPLLEYWDCRHFTWFMPCWG